VFSASIANPTSDTNFYVFVGSISRWNFIRLKVQYTIVNYSPQRFQNSNTRTTSTSSLTQLLITTLGTHVHVRPVWYRNTHSYRILPAGPLVAIFQHSLPFLQSETSKHTSGQSVVGLSVHLHITTVHNHNSTSLTRHLPAPTIECLHRPLYKLMCSSRQSVALRITSNLYSFSAHTVLQ
jgi:hypothetical protein